MPRPLHHHRSGRGFTILAFLVLLVAGILTYLVSTLGPDVIDAYRMRKTEAALAEAKLALLGFAMTYRDTHPGEVFGYFPCPDTDNDGEAELSCGSKDVTVVGRLPWKTLKIPDLRDGDGECLWYVVAGHFKYNPKTDALNWDTTSRLQLQNADGEIVAVAGQHGATAAVVISPGRPLGTQDRTSAGSTVCGGSNSSNAYLEGLTINATAEVDGNNATNSIVTAATRASLEGGTNNDRVLAVRSAEVFDQVQKRSDFSADIGNALLTSIAGCLNGVSLPDGSGSKGIEAALGICGATSTTAQFTLSQNIQNNWKDNLLYAKGSVTVNGESCDAILAFSGARTGGQTRAIATQRDAVANYLEGGNEAVFLGTGGTAYSGGTVFDSTMPAADLFRCLKPSGPITVSFDHDIGRFNDPEGNGLSITLESIPNHPGVDIVPSGSTTGGCLWFPSAIPLNGRAVRIFFRSEFSLQDQFALPLAAPPDTSDEGYGFTFQVVNGEEDNAPNICGRTSNMGALRSSFSPWGSRSYIFETDVHYRESHSDPEENHVAILLNGSLEHSSEPTTACNGSQPGCAMTPANSFEDSPSPKEHNHRIEMVSGCNDSCTDCNPASPAGDKVHLRLWVDCTGSACNDLTADLPATPMATYCDSLPSELNQFYFGFTGGFFNSQGVRIWDFNLRSEIP